jgi:hypothetical protein
MPAPRPWRPCISSLGGWPPPGCWWWPRSPASAAPRRWRRWPGSAARSNLARCRLPRWPSWPRGWAWSIGPPRCSSRPVVTPRSCWRRCGCSATLAASGKQRRFPSRCRQPSCCGPPSRPRRRGVAAGRGGGRTQLRPGPGRPPRSDRRGAGRQAGRARPARRAAGHQRHELRVHQRPAPGGAVRDYPGTGARQPPPAGGGAAGWSAGNGRQPPRRRRRLGCGRLGLVGRGRAGHAGLFPARRRAPVRRGA